MNGRLPSFGEKPIQGDIFVPGDFETPTRFINTTDEESRGAVRPENTWKSEWVRPKPVEMISGNRLLTYKRDAFRKLSKEKMMAKINIIPRDETTRVEMQNFGRVPVGLGTLGQTAQVGTETGAWGNLVSALVAGATTYLGTQSKEQQAAQLAQQRYIQSQQQASILSSPNLILFAVIGGFGYLILTGRKTRKR